VHIDVQPSPRAVAREAARLIADAVADRPSLAIALPTGQTPLPLYRELIVSYAQSKIDFSHVSFFNLDEFAGLGHTDAGSYHAFLKHHLLDPLGIRANQIFTIRGDARDPVAEAARYEQAIAKRGGIDIAVLGIGANGHIGFNEPGKALFARTHRARLTAATRRANAGLFAGRASEVPREALSMGMGTILAARAIVLIATGRSKARAISAMFSGRITPSVPASFLQLHQDTTLVLDRAASQGL
jgi:glucosamine-6-phosphate deaminase